MSKYYIGTMCGTSLDSVDVSITSFESKKIKIIDFQSYPLGNQLKKEINLHKSKYPSKKNLDKLNLSVSLLMSKYINKIITKNKLNAEHIKAIGYPGITLNHDPSKKRSEYLGDAEKINLKTGIPVVADFRQTDIDCGGQGAPLSALFHSFLYNKDPVIFVNLGGFANITLKKGYKFYGYDTGPANYLLDLWCQKKLNKEFDASGNLAQKGEVQLSLLNSMLKDKYFKKLPPKSTGFEYFNWKWLMDHLSKYKNINKLNVLSTLTYLTSITVAQEINKYHVKSKFIFFAGGGSKNKMIVDKIIELTGKKRQLKLKNNIDEKNLETVSFAWLAKMRINKQKIPNLSITGSKKSSLLGFIYH
tara:strand:+ start:1735 stop:2814 length:1080 start_codon:yes stop_codon:yes gene_type:complete